MLKYLCQKHITTEDIASRDKKELRNTRFLPTAANLPTVTYIYGTKVAHLALEKDFIGVMIENESIAKSQKAVFEIMWKAARAPAG